MGVNLVGPESRPHRMMTYIAMGGPFYRLWELRSQDTMEFQDYFLPPVSLSDLAELMDIHRLYKTQFISLPLVRIVPLSKFKIDFNFLDSIGTYTSSFFPTQPN